MMRRVGRAGVLVAVVLACMTPGAASALPVHGKGWAHGKPAPTATSTSTSTKPHGHATKPGHGGKHVTQVTATPSPAPVLRATAKQVLVAPAPRIASDSTTHRQVNVAPPAPSPSAASAPRPVVRRAAAVSSAPKPLLGPGGPTTAALAGIATRNPSLPLAAIVVLVIFLAVQNRIDRNEPKLATARDRDQDNLLFRDVVRPRRPHAERVLPTVVVSRVPGPRAATSLPW